MDLQNLRQLNRFFGATPWSPDFCAIGFNQGNRARCSTCNGFRRYSASGRRSCDGSLDANVESTAVDQQASTLEIARQLSADYPEITFHHGDIPNGETAAPMTSSFARSLCITLREDDAVRLLTALPRTFAGLCFGLRLAPRIFCHCWRFSSHRHALSRTDDAGMTDARPPHARFPFGNSHALAERAGWKNFHQRQISFCAPGRLAGSAAKTRRMEIFTTTQEAQRWRAREQKATRSCADDGRTASRSSWN